MARHRGWAVALVALAAPAFAQQDAGGSAGQQGGTSDAFERACVDLLHGRMPGGGEQAIKSLQKACNGLMDARAQEPIQAAERRKQQQELAQAQSQLQQGGTGAGGEAQQARVEPGQSSRQAQQGQGVLAAFEQAGREVMGPRRGAAMGMRQGGPVVNTLVTNPIGYFTGLGVNAELYRVLEPRFSWVAGARYSTTDATNGTATTFGLMGGADFFVIGRNNEGLRIGPRVEFALGREDFQGRTTFARMGLSGEVGYNFVATNGITGLLAGGLGGRVAGDSENDNFAGFTGGEFGPYFKVGVGYSW
jgi:hypothetical protein